MKEPIYDPNKKHLLNDLDRSHYKYQKIQINRAREFNLEIDCLIDRIDRMLKE